MSAPRIAPPLPRGSRLVEWRRSAKLAGIRPMPWQLIASRYVMAMWRGRWLYPEVAIVVARQNGKSEILVPRILRALEVGERVMHSAQDRTLPRETFTRVADLVPRAWLRRPIRLANGQESIETWAGGRYRIVAPTRGGARGPTNDLVIFDEVREATDFEFVAAAAPTLTAARNGQFIYLSNAGDESSLVLNSLRARRETDPKLCYLEWSAAPERALDDELGWAEANPALGITIRIETLRRFRDQYQAQPAIFETEHLCRWVASMLTKLVPDVSWQRAGPANLEAPLRPALGISADPDGHRISAQLAWAQSDGTIALRSAAEITGDPVDIDEAGRRILELALELGVPRVGFDPATDRDLARHFEHPGLELARISGAEFAAASARFVATIEGGRLRWSDAGEVGADLAFTVRRDAGDAWAASRADDARPICAALAAIRAVWLATSPLDLVPVVH